MQNDLIFISHYHDSTDGYVKLESESRQMDGGSASATAVDDRSATSPLRPKDHYAAFPEQVKAPLMQHPRLLMSLPRS